jgi:hypothetical protein
MLLMGWLHPLEMQGLLLPTPAPALKIGLFTFLDFFNSWLLVTSTLWGTTC